MGEAKFGEDWTLFERKLEEKRRSLRNEDRERGEFLDEFRRRIQRYIEPAFREAALAAGSREGFRVEHRWDKTHEITITVVVHGQSERRHTFGYRADPDRRLVIVFRTGWINGEDADEHRSGEVEIERLDESAGGEPLRSFIRGLDTPSDIDH